MKTIKPIKPIIFLADDNRLHKLVQLTDAQLEDDICCTCSLKQYCSNHVYDNDYCCLCDAILHRFATAPSANEYFFHFERVEYDKSLQGETLNVIPNYKRYAPWKVWPIN